IEGPVGVPPLLGFQMRLADPGGACSNCVQRTVCRSGFAVIAVAVAYPPPTNTGGLSSATARTTMKTLANYRHELRALRQRARTRCGAHDCESRGRSRPDEVRVIASADAIPSTADAPIRPLRPHRARTPEAASGAGGDGHRSLGEGSERKRVGFSNLDSRPGSSASD